MKTYVLLNCLDSASLFKRAANYRGLPTIEQVRSITENGDRLIVVDSQLNRKIAKSALEKYYEFKNIEELRTYSTTDYRFMMIDKSPHAWSWKIEREDIRESDDTVVYVDYSNTRSSEDNTPNGNAQLPPEITDDLFVMYMVKDYKHTDRSYMRNIDYEQLQNIEISAKPYFDWRNSEQTSELNRKMYSMICKCVGYYMENNFLDDVVVLPYGILQSNIICSEKPLSYPLNLNHPALEGFVHAYDIMPDPPEGKYGKTWNDDKLAYVSTGINPTYLMRSSSQYRQFFSNVVKRVMSHMLKKDGYVVDFESADAWKELAEKLVE